MHVCLSANALVEDVIVSHGRVAAVDVYLVIAARVVEVAGLGRAEGLVGRVAAWAGRVGVERGASVEGVVGRTVPATRGLSARI